MLVTITQTTPSPPLQVDTDDLELRGWYSQTIIGGDGVTVVESGNGQTGFYYSIPCTRDGSGNLVIPAFAVQSTVGSNPTANFFAQLWVNGAPNQMIIATTPQGSGWHVPISYGATITFAQLATYNRAKRLVYAPSTYLTTDQTVLTIEQIAGDFDYAAVGINGITALDTAPASASLPIAIGVNSRRASDFYNIIAYGAATTKTAAQNATAIAAAVTAAAITGGGIYIPVGTFITNSVTVSVPIQFADGTSILSSPSGQTNTYTKSFEASPQQHLAGLGTHSFVGNIFVGLILPQWWGAIGDGLTNSTTQIAAAWAALITIGQGVLKFSSGTYLTTASLKPASNCCIQGSGTRDTIISYSGAGRWLDNTDIGTIMRRFEWTDMTLLVTGASGMGGARIGDVTEDFDETNQHIECHFKRLRIVGHTGSIVAGSHGLELGTFIRTQMIDLIVEDFDVPYYFRRFDEAWMQSTRAQRFTTYGWDISNADGDAQPPVCDESVFINNMIEEIPNTATAAVYLNELESLRIHGLYMEPGVAGTMPIAYKLTGMRNVSIDGGTISTATKAFELLNCQDLVITHVGTQDLNATPASTCVWDTYGTVLSPFYNPEYGRVSIIDCSRSISNSFARPTPGLRIEGDSKYGGAKSFNKSAIGGVKGLYGQQLLGLNGTNGRMSETDLILGPFQSNNYMEGTNPATVVPTVDAAASGGWALKVPAFLNAVMGLEFPYPGDILPGQYEAVARVRYSSAVSEALYVHYDGSFQETPTITGLTTYQTFVFPFRFNPGGTTTLSVWLGHSTVDLYIDYLLIRPAFNSIVMQEYVAPTLSGVGTNGSYRTVYMAAMPTTGAWRQGDLVQKTGVAIDATGLVLIGWKRLTTGSAHVLGTDWAALYSSGTNGRSQLTPSTPTTAATLTVTNLLIGILTATPTATGATVAYTLPTGTNMSGGATFASNDSFDWSITNLAAAAADTITITANTDHTIVGNPIVQSANAATGSIYGNAAMFRSRKISATVWVTYRIG